MKLSANANDLTGQRFGRLVVRELAGRDKKGRILWLCDCDCGGTKATTPSNLRTGNTTSCGCVKCKDHTGERHGHLTAIKMVGRSKNQAQWLCKCDCGNERVVPAYDFKNGKIEYCGRKCPLRQHKSGHLSNERYKKLLANRPKTDKIAGVFQNCHGSWSAFISFRGVRYQVIGSVNKETAVKARLLAEEYKMNYLDTNSRKLFKPDRYVAEHLKKEDNQV